MTRNSRFALIIIFCIFAIIGLIDANSIRAAIANNAWSVAFIHQLVQEPNSDPRAFSPPMTHPRAGLLLAHQALKLNQLDYAIEYLKPMSSSSDPLVLNSIAKTAFLHGSFQEAIEIWKRLGDWFALEQASQAFNDDDLLIERIQALQGAYELFPDRYARSLLNAKLTKAKQLLDANQTNEAITAFLALIDQFPDDGRPYGYLANAYMQAEQAELAIQAIEAGWTLNNENVHFYNSAGNIFERLEMYDRALNAFQQTLLINPNHSDALLSVERLTGENQ